MARSARSAGFGALALAVLAVAGCDPYVQGNGVYFEEARTPAEALTGVRAFDGIEATVTAGAAEQRVVVSGDANLVPYIRTTVVDEVGEAPVFEVSIEVPGGTWSSSIPPRVVVELASLEYLFATDDSHVDASDVATQLLFVEAYGRSDVVVSGAGGGRIDVVASGATVWAGSYPVSDGAQVDLSLGARAWLHSDGAVTGTVRAGCTLDNQLGSGTCAGVLVPANETPPPTISCAPPP
jgi:hypothetical protein